jgi:cell wall-associated NlpC family hydrolase
MIQQANYSKQFRQRAWPPLRSRPRVAADAIILGHGTLLARVRRDRGLLQLDIPDDESLAGLLSAAYDRPIQAGDRMIGLIKEAAHALRLGRISTAEDMLECVPLDQLTKDGADRLSRADALLKSRLAIRQANDDQLLKDEISGGNPNHLPCGPGGGQFCSAGAAGGISTDQGAKIVDQADRWEGTPYASSTSGLAGPRAQNQSGADCSGSVHAIYVQAGFGYAYQPSGAFAAAARNGMIPFKEIAANELQPGDVVLYEGHMSIYAGNGDVWSAHRHDGTKFNLSPMRFFGAKQTYFRYQSGSHLK